MHNVIDKAVTSQCNSSTSSDKTHNYFRKERKDLKLVTKPDVVYLILFNLKVIMSEFQCKYVGCFLVIQLLTRGRGECASHITDI